MTIKNRSKLRTESSNGGSAICSLPEPMSGIVEEDRATKMYSCSKCHKQITDRTVSMCDNRFWHQSCLTCQMCGHTPSPVSGESLYAYRGSLICKSDYMRMNCVCKSCSRPITQSDLVIKTNNCGLIHDKCVFCRNCAVKLHPGDRYFMTVDNSLVCHKCMSTQPNSNNGPGPASIKMDMDDAQQQQQGYGQQGFLQRQQSHGSMGPPMNMGGQFMNNQNGGSKHSGIENGNYSNGMGNGLHGGMPTPPPGSGYMQGPFSNQMMNNPQQTSSAPATSTANTGTTTGSRRGRKKQNQNPPVNLM